MLAPEIEQQLALAGVCQAATLVQRIARTGEFDAKATEASLSSILVTNPFISEVFKNSPKRHTSNYVFK